MSQSLETKKEYFTYQNILDVQKNKGRGLRIDLDYDPKIFWESIGKAYFKNFQKKDQFQAGVGWVLDRLKVLNVDTLLDCGTGFCRILPFLIDGGGIKSAVGIDISKELLECSDEYLRPQEYVWCDDIKFINNQWVIGDSIIDDSWKSCPKCGSVKPQKPVKETKDFRECIATEVGDVRKLSFDSDSFDCTFSFECLQHLPEEDIDSALSEMVRVSKKVIMICERWAFPGERFEPHYFSHNYVDRLKAMGLNIAQVSAIGSGLQGIIAIKR